MQRTYPSLPSTPARHLPTVTGRSSPSSLSTLLSSGTLPPAAAPTVLNNVPQNLLPPSIAATATSAAPAPCACPCHCPCARVSLPSSSSTCHPPEPGTAPTLYSAAVVNSCDSDERDDSVMSSNAEAKRMGMSLFSPRLGFIDVERAVAGGGSSISGRVDRVEEDKVDGVEMGRDMDKGRRCRGWEERGCRVGACRGDNCICGCVGPFPASGHDTAVGVGCAEWGERVNKAVQLSLSSLRADSCSASSAYQLVIQECPVSHQSPKIESHVSGQCRAGGSPNNACMPGIE